MVKIYALIKNRISQGVFIKLIAVFVGLMSSVFFAHSLSTESYGLYLLLIKYVNLFVALSYLGLDKLIIKLYAGNKRFELKGLALFVILVTFTTLYYIVYGVTALIVDLPVYSKVFQNIILFGPLLFLPKTAQSVLLTYRRVNLALLLEGVAISVLLLILFFLSRDIYMSTLIAWVIIAIISLLLIHRITDNASLAWFSKYKIKSALDYYFGGISHLSYSTFTLLIIGSLLSNTDVAIYSVVSRLTLVTVLFQQVYTSVYAVEFRRLFESQNFEALKSTSFRLSFQLLIVSIIISGILFLWATEILGIWGKEYSEEGLVAFRILLLAGVFNSWFYLKGTILNMSDNERFMRNLGLFITLAGIALTYFLSEYIGIVGASLSYLIIVLIEGLMRSKKVKELWDFTLQ